MILFHLVHLLNVHPLAHSYVLCIYYLLFSWYITSNTYIHSSVHSLYSLCHMVCFPPKYDIYLYTCPFLILLYRQSSTLLNRDVNGSCFIFSLDNSMNKYTLDILDQDLTLDSHICSFYWDTEGFISNR